MAKKDNVDDYLNKLSKVKLPKDRQNLKMVSSKLTFGEYLMQATMEGFKLLEEEEIARAKNPISVKVSPGIETTVGALNKNPYAQARIEILKKMSPELKTIIEKMEKGLMEKDTRWDTFCKAIRLQGDQSSN